MPSRRPSPKPPTAICSECAKPSSSTPPQPGGESASRLQLIRVTGSVAMRLSIFERHERRSFHRPSCEFALTTVDIEIEILLGEGIVGAIGADCLDRCVDLVLQLGFALAQADADAGSKDFRIVRHIAFEVTAFLAL